MNSHTDRNTAFGDLMMKTRMRMMRMKRRRRRRTSRGTFRLPSRTQGGTAYSWRNGGQSLKQIERYLGDADSTMVSVADY